MPTDCAISLHLTLLPSDIRFDVQHNLTPESERTLVAWCVGHGLLGLLPHHFDRIPPESVVLGPMDDGPFWLKSGFRYEAGEWLSREADTPFEPLTHDKLQSFFPGIKLEPWPSSTDVPEPTSEEFWRIYGEPIDYFANQCQELADVVEALDSVPLEESSYATFVPDSLEALNRLTASLSPIADFDAVDSHFSIRWRSRSLIANFAMMIVQYLANSRRVDICHNCETAFLSHSPKALYCSERCRNTAEKRRKRRRDRENKQKGKP